MTMTQEEIEEMEDIWGEECPVKRQLPVIEITGLKDCGDCFPKPRKGDPRVLQLFAVEKLRSCDSKVTKVNIGCSLKTRAGYALCFKSCAADFTFLAIKDNIIFLDCGLKASSIDRGDVVAEVYLQKMYDFYVLPKGCDKNE